MILCITLKESFQIVTSAAVNFSYSEINDDPAAANDV